MLADPFITNEVEADKQRQGALATDKKFLHGRVDSPNGVASGTPSLPPAVDLVFGLCSERLNANGPPKEAAALARLNGKLAPLSLKARMLVAPGSRLAQGVECQRRAACACSPRSDFPPALRRRLVMCSARQPSRAPIALGLPNRVAVRVLVTRQAVELRNPCDLHLRLPLSVVDRTLRSYTRSERSQSLATGHPRCSLPVDRMFGEGSEGG